MPFSHPPALPTLSLLDCSAHLSFVSARVCVSCCVVANRLGLACMQSGIPLGSNGWRASRSERFSSVCTSTRIESHRVDLLRRECPQPIRLSPSKASGATPSRAHASAREQTARERSAAAASSLLIASCGDAVVEGDLRHARSPRRAATAAHLSASWPLAVQSSPPSLPPQARCRCPLALLCSLSSSPCSLVARCLSRARLLLASRV